MVHPPGPNEGRALLEEVRNRLLRALAPFAGRVGVRRRTRSALGSEVSTGLMGGGGEPSMELLGAWSRYLKTLCLSIQAFWDRF